MPNDLSVTEKLAIVPFVRPLPCLPTIDPDATKDAIQFLIDRLHDIATDPSALLPNVGRDALYHAKWRLEAEYAGYLRGTVETLTQAEKAVS